MKETNETSINIDSYCFKITIKSVCLICDITVGHIPRELSRLVFYFIHEGGSVTGTFASITLRQSPIPEGALTEIPIIMHFVHENKLILDKISTFFGKQVEKMTLEFKFETTEETEEEKKDNKIEVQCDSEDCVEKEKTQSSNKDIAVVIID